MPFICGTDYVRTMAEAERDAVAMAEELAARGLRPGDRVLLKADNSYGYLTSLLALMHAQASVVLADHLEKADATERLMLHVGVVWCIVDDDVYMPDTPVTVTSILELQFGAMQRGHSGAALDTKPWQDRFDGMIMWSSGSTGSPKAIVKSGGSFLTNLKRNADLVGHVPDDVLVPLLPFSHQYGLSMLLIAWQVGCSLVIAPYRRLDHALRLAGRCGGTVFDATPATYRSMMNLTGRRPALFDVLKNARMLCVGAAPLDINLVAKYGEVFGHPLLDSYGSTELGNVAFANLDNPVACGRPVDGVELAIHDEDGNPLAAGEVGELMVRTPDVMAGYLDEFGVLEPVKGDWFASGDFGLIDEGGSLHVLGRKRAVHRMGYTLYPDIIERRIAEAGCTAKVVAVPDDRMGSQLVAFVQDEQAREAGYWRERMATVLPAYELPNRVVVVDAFPLNNNGKPDGKQLEKMAVAA